MVVCLCNTAECEGGVDAYLLVTEPAGTSNSALLVWAEGYRGPRLPVIHCIPVFIFPYLNISWHFFAILESAPLDSKWQEYLSCSLFIYFKDKSETLCHENARQTALLFMCTKRVQLPTSAKKSGQKTEEERRWCFGPGWVRITPTRGQKAASPACPCVLQNLLPYSLNFKPQCRMFYVSGKVLHILDNSKDYSGHCGLQLYDFLLSWNFPKILETFLNSPIFSRQCATRKGISKSPPFAD